MRKVKTITKRFFSLFLAIVMVCTTQNITVFAETGNALAPQKQAEGNTISKGDIISFGSYPQTAVQNVTEEIVNAQYDENGDATVAGVKYRRVKGGVNMVVTREEYEKYYLKQNPNETSVPSDAWNDEYLAACEKEKAEKGKYYYFKWEPIKWKVLENESESGTVFVMAENVLDARDYSDDMNANYAKDGVLWKDSDLRKWMNTDTTGFYNTAFSGNEKNAIKVNAGNPDGDRVYVLSYEEAKNTNYGFEDTDGASVSRQREATQYAVMKKASIYGVGAQAYSSFWYLRTPGDRGYVKEMAYTGGMYQTQYHSRYLFDNSRNCYERSFSGCVPVMHLDVNYQVKMQAAEELRAYKSDVSYRSPQQKERQKAINNGIKAINAAVSYETIQKALADAKAVIDKIKVNTESNPEEEDNASSSNKTVLKSLNFDIPEDSAYKQDELNTGTKSINTMSEPVVTKAGTDGKTYIFNYDKDENVRDALDEKNASLETTYTAASSVKPYTITKTVDADGDGKKELLVLLYLNGTKSGGDIMMTVSDLRTQECLFEAQPTGGYIATSDAIPPYGLEGLLSMCVGDFDGDGCEEVAVYTPNNKDETASGSTPVTLQIKIYKLDSLSAELAAPRQVIDIAKVGSDQKDCQEWLYSHSGGKKQYYNLPYMRLTAGDINKDNIDDLLTVASFSTIFRGAYQEQTATWKQVLNPNYCFSSVLDVYQGQRQDAEPLKQIVKKRVLVARDSNNSNDWNKGCGLLRNASVTVANVTGANSNEIVIGGNYTGFAYDENTTENTTVTKNRYVWVDGNDAAKIMVGYVSCQGLLSDDSSAAALSYNWTMQENAYSRLHYYNGDDNGIDPANEPVTLDGFAAYGSAQPDTIAIQGQLFNYSEDDGKLKCSSYVMPHADLGGIKASNIWVSSQTVGNVTNDAFGRETLYFTECQKRSGKEGYWNDIISVWGKVDVNGNKGFTGKVTIDTNSNEKAAKKHTIAMSDIDVDSSFIQYEEGNTDVYYSNVQVLSVLQAAPVYKDLGEDYVSDAETSYGKSSGSSTGSGHTHQVSAGVIAGFEHETSFLGLVNLFSMEVTAELAVTAGWEFENTVEKEFTTSYNTSGTEDVAVLYTVPYVRYNGQIYIPTYTLPTKEEYDAKSAFCEELKSNIEKYLDIKAGVNGGVYSKPKDGYNDEYTTDVNAKNYDYQLRTLHNYMEWLEQTESQMEGFEGSEGLIWGQEIEGGWEDYFFCVPQTPIITSVSTKTYDEIAAGCDDLQPLYGTALPKDYVAGHPETYAGNINELKERTTIDLDSVEEGKTNSDNDSDGFISSTAISASSSAPSQTISFTEENAKSTSIGGSLSLEMVATVGEVKGGVSVSTEHAATWSRSTTNGCEFSGQVPNLPQRPDYMTQQQYSNYDYKWKLVSYEAMVNGSKVPVVGYYTRFANPSQLPPSSPSNIDFEDVQSDSITLMWNAGNRAADHYNIYQVTGSRTNKEYNKIGTVSVKGDEKGVFRFKHDKLESNQTYTYVVGACNADESSNSVYSEEITTTTPIPEFDVTIKQDGINSQETYLAGTQKTLTASLETKNYPNSEIEQYIWQVNDGNGWQKISNGTDKSYTWKTLTKMDGYQYRCCAYVAVDNRLYRLYSDAATLHVRKAEIKINISADKKEGAADPSSEFGLAEYNGDILRLKADITSQDVSKLSGNVIFVITEKDNESNVREYSAAISEDGIAQIECKFSKAGKYTICARYTESEEIKGADSVNSIPYYAYDISLKEERAHGQNMENTINEQIGNDVTIENVMAKKEQIESIKNNYANMTGVQKEFVDTDAKEKLDNAVNHLAAAETVEIMDAVEGVTVNNAATNKESIAAAKTAYESLTEEQKALVPKEKVNQLKTAEDALQASEAVEKIQAIGTVTDENAAKKETLIKDAQKAYESLTEEQKALIPANVKKALETAQKTYKEATDDATKGMTANEKKQVSSITDKLGVSKKTAVKIKKLADTMGIDNDTILLTDKEIEKEKTDKDVKGSQFGKLQAKASKVTSNQVKLTWKKIKGADGYLLYQAECGKKVGYKKIKEIKKASTKSCTVKKLKKGKGYRFLIRAYKVVDGKKITISAAKTVHIVTNGGKKSNVTQVKVNKAKVNLKKGKKFKLKASEVKKGKKGVKCRKVCFESSNSKVATVTKSGAVKAKGKGKCTIYVYAHNGVCKQVKVTVK